MQKIVIGNWKLNPKTKTESITLAQALLALDVSQVMVGCAPSFVHLDAVAGVLTNDKIWLGVQDICPFGASGAFTGDVSAAQVADLGAGFALIGHSERRQYHKESDETLASKIWHAFDAGLSVVFCIGESKQQYEQGKTKEVLQHQLAILAQFADALALYKGAFPRLIVAYEPVWAIGTGLTPTFDEIETIHKFIASLLSTFKIVAPILYGGSVNDKNAPELAKSELIDGVLVGGASLKIDGFATIVSAFANTNAG